MSKFYLTTPIYYVNDRPHIGHAYTTFAADAIVAWHRLRGDEVFFLTGTDENAQKNREAAAKQLGKSIETVTRAEVQTYVDEMSVVWQQAWDMLGIRYDRFIRTTEPAHIASVEKFIAAVQAKGDIYRGMYRGWYCVGCEAFVPESDLVDGKCPTHQRTPEQIEEDNYFFKLSKYRDALLQYIDKNPKFIQPESRRNEIVAYIDQHLTDISISRPMKNWGIPFPGDPDQAVYVWFDALVNYLTGVGYGSDDARFAKLWPATVHLVGKDIIKFHCALWPAMLMSAGLELPERVFAHGFFTISGQKMSKSLGNVIDPIAMAQKYGTDALRYFLAREIPFGGDGDFSEERLQQRYAADLQHGIGNFAARTIAMIHKYANGKAPAADGESPAVCNPSDCTARAGRIDRAWEQYAVAMDELASHDALDVLTEVVRAGDRYIEAEHPWGLTKSGETERLHRALGNLAETLRHVALMAVPFMPETADKILAALGQSDWRSERLSELQKWGKIKEGTTVGELAHLFPPLQ
ncbi:MAG: methionine--tRNA ligase [Candidatus Uhrbacteria bacterium]